MDKIKFGMIGGAGYVAAKHFEAIKQVGGEVVALVDPNDNLEILDVYFPDCEFFHSLSEFEPFLRKNKLDYITICSPSHLHAGHIEFALQHGCDVICESPMVLTKGELERAAALELETGKKVYNILQYRYHPEVLRLKDEIEEGRIYHANLVNHTLRGKWFDKSWKGNPAKSGGILTSLGYHLFDALMVLFGNPVLIDLEHETAHEAKGKLILENALVDFSFSTASRKGKTGIKRVLTVDGHQIDFNEPVETGFQKTYEEILSENGFGTTEVANIIVLLSM